MSPTSRDRSEAVPATAVDIARLSYRPETIEWLFVAEAPPASVDRFFYFDSVAEQDALFIQTMRVLYSDVTDAEAQAIRGCKAKLLRAFRAEGCYLIDACERPMEDTRQSARLACVRAALPSLERKLGQLRQEGQLTARTKIVLVTRTVYDGCFERLIASGFNVVNDELIEFPGSGHQGQFREKLNRLLNAHGRPTPAPSGAL